MLSQQTLPQDSCKYWPLAYSNSWYLQSTYPPIWEAAYTPDLETLFKSPHLRFSMLCSICFSSTLIGTCEMVFNYTVPLGLEHKANVYKERKPCGCRNLEINLTSCANVYLGRYEHHRSCAVVALTGQYFFQ